MIEQGLVQLIQTGITSLSPAVQGGYAVQLPKDTISATNPWAWTYRFLEADPSYHLTGQDGLTGAMIRIDAHGFTAVNMILLARAIDSVLRGGYSGVLTDPDSTVVLGIFRQNHFVDGYDDTNRSFCRTMDYLVNYQQQ